MIVPVLFAVFGAALAGNVRDANLFMDTVLRTYMPTEISNARLDPLTLPNYKTNFNVRNMNASFYSGKMTGLKEIRRQGDCSAPGLLNGNVTVGCNIVMDRLVMEYTSLFNYNGYPQRVLKTVARFGTTYALLEASGKQGRQADLRQLAVRTLGTLNLQFSGLGNLPLFSDIENGYKTETVNMFNHVMQTLYMPALSRAIRRVPLPNP